MKFWITLYGLVIASFLLLAHEWTHFPDEKMHITILDIGQGDALLITTPAGQRILIDGGPDMTLLERLGEEFPFLDRHIDLVLLTHPDVDHVTALPEILRRYNVQHIFLTGIDPNNSRYAALLRVAEEEGIETLFADADHDLSFGEGVFLDILWPQTSMLGKNVQDVNNTSVVAKLLWNDGSMLLTGDIETPVEEELLRIGTDLSADILKVAHHGSRTSSSTGFLLAVHPKLALISSGSGNSFGHPHPDVLARYRALGIPVRRTDQEGTLRVVTSSPVLP